CAAKTLQQLRLPLRLLLDHETLQQRRRPQRLPEPISARKRKVNDLSAIEQQLEQHPFLVPPVVDLANAERAAIVIGKQRIVETPLREEIVLHADGEEMVE